MRKVAVLAIVFILLLSSCDNSNNNSVESVKISSSSNTDNWVKEVLSDDKITDEELIEAKQKEQECYAEFKSTIEYDEYGYMSTHTDGAPSDLQKAMSECGKRTGGIIQMYYANKANPNNEDIYALQAKCAVKKGLAPEGFDVNDLNQMYLSHSFSWDVNSKEWEQCSKDPLGSITGETIP